VEEPAAPANYSIQVADSTAGDRSPQGYHFLFRNIQTVVRSRDVGRVVTGLFSYLSGHFDRADDYLQVDALVVIFDGSALIVPADVRHHLPMIERRLHREGFRVVDAPFVLIDPAGPDVVVPRPAVGVDWSVLDQWSTAHLSGRHRDPAVPAGPYPLKGWAFGLGPVGELSPARAVTHAGAALLNPHELGTQRALDMLAELVTSVTTMRLWAGEPEGLVGPLVELAKGAGRSSRV
jgi:hypothetical protein